MFVNKLTETVWKVVVSRFFENFTRRRPLEVLMMSMKWKLWHLQGKKNLFQRKIFSWLLRKSGELLNKLVFVMIQFPQILLFSISKLNLVPLLAFLTNCLMVNLHLKSLMKFSTLYNQKIFFKQKKTFWLVNILKRE